MGYRVVLTKNGEYKKTLHKCQTRDTAYINYRRFKKQNESVIFPRKFVNYGKLIPVEYEILIVKDIEDGDKNRFVRDKMGKLYEEQPLGGIWTIIDSAEWNEEETFWLYGHDPKNDRQTIRGILKKLMIGAYSKKNVKEVLVVHNKLVIYSEEQFDMVICKCKEDAQRLHHKLAKATSNNKMTGLLFLGTATPATVSRMYEVIHEHTKWPMKKIRRTSTRH
jgi:hypothetical protein